MPSRKQLHSIHVASGLTMQAIVERTGIPMESLMSLVSGDGGKDPKQLINEVTFESVNALLGIDKNFDKLRKNTVVVWRCVDRMKKSELPWIDAVQAVRNDFLSPTLQVAEIRMRKTLFGRSRSILLLRDVENDLRIAVPFLRVRARGQLLDLLGVTPQRVETVSAKEYQFICQLIDNAVYSVVQFDGAIGGDTAKYAWADVRASAKEFGFQTDDLINLMVAHVQQRKRAEAAATEATRTAAESSQRSIILSVA